MDLDDVFIQSSSDLLLKWNYWIGCQNLTKFQDWLDQSSEGSNFQSPLFTNVHWPPLHAWIQPNKGVITGKDIMRIYIYSEYKGRTIFFLKVAVLLLINFLLKWKLAFEEGSIKACLMWRSNYYQSEYCIDLYDFCSFVCFQ